VKNLNSLPAVQCAKIYGVLREYRNKGYSWRQAGGLLQRRFPTVRLSVQTVHRHFKGLPKGAKGGAS